MCGNALAQAGHDAGVDVEQVIARHAWLAGDACVCVCVCVCVCMCVCVCVCVCACAHDSAFLREHMRS